MDIDEALAYLDQHASYHKTGRVESPSVDPIRSLCAALGDPHHAYPVIHVTGTNGKGSTVEMISRLVMSMGLTVGTYTSPHLERINERIRRNGEPISDEEFAEQLSGVAAVEALTGVRPTYFEAVTAACFSWFASVAVDVAVVEVGMLGRWDATNIVESKVAVITNIALDHTEFAGPTLADIATEKAGIIKASSTAVIGTTDPALTSIFESAPGASTIRRGSDFEVLDNSLAVGGRAVDVRTPHGRYDDVYLPLHGAHQGDNAVIAVAAVEAFFDAALPDAVVREALGTVEMPGRFEVLGVQPLVVVDGAHNPRGADVCAEVFFADFQPDGRRILVIGTLRDPAEMVAAIRADEFDIVHACTAPSPLGVAAVEVARAAQAAGATEVFVHDSVEAACQFALRGAGADDAILVAGSIYVAGAARPVLVAGAN